MCLRYNAGYRHEDPNNGLVADGASRHYPTQGHDTARLEVPNDCAGHGARLSNDEELGYVYQQGEHAGLERVSQAGEVMGGSTHEKNH